MAEEDRTKFYYDGIMLRRYFDKFQQITYHGVQICKFLYFHFSGFVGNNYSLKWALENVPYLQDELNQYTESEIYSWSDEPYLYDPHPDGIVLMRGGFVDIASIHLPKERYFLISHNQAEVDLIKASMPDQDPHSIEEYFRDNPKVIADLTGQVAEVISEQKDDPILGSPKLLQWFKDNMTKTVHILDAVQSLFERMNVSAVLTISAINWMESALNLVARANRIPSFTGQHGIIVDAALFGHVPILATKKLVWGNATRDWFTKYGFPESRVSVIGSPRYEIIFNRKWWDKQELCKVINVDPSQKIIIFATQRLYLSQDSVPIVLEGLKSIPNVFLVLLLHPSEAPVIESYQELVKDCPNCKVVRFGHISLYDALSGADFFITCYSTSALEAMLFKRPVITIEPTPPEYSYGDAGASIKVTNTAEFTEVLNRLISDETYRTNAVNQYQKYLYDYCIPDGLASKRLFDEIEAMSKTSGSA